MTRRFDIRPARAGDEPGIAAVHWAARRRAYADLLPRENLDGRTVAALTEEWVGILKRDDGAETLVAEAAAAVGAASSFEARLRRAPQDEDFFPAASPRPHPEVRGDSPASPRPHPEVRGDSRASKERTRAASSPLQPRILGFVTGGPVRARTQPIIGDLSGVTAEVSLLYVLPEEMGRGLGRALFGRSVERLLRLGHEALVVWGHRDNPYLRFYERLGGLAAAASAWEVEGRLYPTRGYVWRDLPALVEACNSSPTSVERA
jgi:GNAT superfamily N-acetyltransferase